MALELEYEDILTSVSRHLDGKLRYRCLVFQARHFKNIISLCEYSLEAAQHVLGESIHEVKAVDKLDDVGAVSCSAIINELESVCSEKAVVISGPLNFLDYWSKDVCGSFWRYLAAFSFGPGIIVVDVQRNEDIIGPFQIIEDVSQGKIRCLKSRLESTQDSLA